MMLILPLITRRNDMLKPAGSLSACNGSANGMFWPLDVNVAAH